MTDIPKKRIIISGRSGSGKSVTLRFLEDLGFYCVDNVPMALFPELMDILNQRPGGIAISLDVRNLPDKAQLLAMIDRIREGNEILYFDADDSTLLRRYSETRRKHPLTSESVSLREAIHQERSLLEPVANAAHLVIDTSHLSTAQLRHIITERVAHRPQETLSILFLSFGYKNGIPQDADYVFDLRCLPNPYWEADLRPLNGKDPQIISYLESKDIVKKMQKEIIHFLNEWIPCFIADKRSYLTIAFGCTGGQHRSAYFAEYFAKYYKDHYPHVQIRHRELDNPV
jgi:UPF0042 nucleotide-binding protein